MLDTIDRIVERHFACVTKQEFVYKQRTYIPQPLMVSPLIFRQFHCPEGCGACCRSVSLDWLPSESYPVDAFVRTIEFNGQRIPVLTQGQPLAADFCQHLRTDTGRCEIHGKHPFECDFAYTIFQPGYAPNRKNTALTRLPGRSWRLLRAVDAKRGALCSVTTPTAESTGDLLRKMNRLLEWTNHFEIDTAVPDIITWIQTGPHDAPLYLNQDFTNQSAYILPQLHREVARVGPVCGD